MIVFCRAQQYRGKLELGRPGEAKLAFNALDQMPGCRARTWFGVVLETALRRETDRNLSMLCEASTGRRDDAP